MQGFLPSNKNLYWEKICVKLESVDSVLSSYFICTKGLSSRSTHTYVIDNGESHITFNIL